MGGTIHSKLFHVSLEEQIAEGGITSSKKSTDRISVGCKRCKCSGNGNSRRRGGKRRGGKRNSSTPDFLKVLRVTIVIVMGPLWLLRWLIVL